MRVAAVLASLLLVAAVAPAQTYIEPFNYADGPTVPGWTQEVGSWSIQNRQLAVQQTSAWQYITLDTFRTLNGMCEVTAIYNLASVMKLQFGGCAMRFLSASDCVMDKIQDNNSSGDFDRFFVYDQPGGSTYVDPTPCLTAVVRLGTFDNTLIGMIDINLDGRWDHTVVHTSAKTPAVGKVGISGYGGCLFDDFKYFDAIVRVDPTGLPPAPGNLVKLELRGDAGLAYQCACSFTNAVGIRVDSRRIPLDPGDLMALSFQAPALFQNFAASLDAAGKGIAGLYIPPLPALKGVWFYFGMITLDPKKPSGIGNISNDLMIEIQ